MSDATGNPTADPTPRRSDPTDTTGEVLPVATAAAVLGITSDVVRARIRRGKLRGEKRGGAWCVFMPDADRRDTTPDRDATADTTVPDTATSVATSNPTPNATVATPAVDLAPFADLIDDLTRRNADLSATAAMWQTRAAYLEDQLKQLTAGETRDNAAQSTQDSPHDEQSGDVELEASASWWRRWWRSLIEGGPQP
jgi:hypothetical protein